MKAESLAALLAGALFGVGLALSGMLIPDKILNFLDLGGHWDPSLALVVGGALAVTIPGYHLVLRRERPRLGARFRLPTRSAIDRSLVSGAALFGVGWGLSGLCPAPALVVTATGKLDILLFAAAMLVGMVLFQRVKEGKS